MTADDLPPNWQQIDALGCYHIAIADAKARVARGEPVPTWLGSETKAPRLCKNPACRKPLVPHDGENASRFARREPCCIKCGRKVAEAKRKAMAASQAVPCRICGSPVNYWRSRAGHDTCTAAACNYAPPWPELTGKDTADFSAHNLRFRAAPQPAA